MRKINFLSIVLFIFFSASQVAAQSAKKNILMIAVDDLNDWTGEFGGHPQSKTPNIDKLAKRSLRFQKAYASSPICNSSRTALLSGRRAHESGVDANYMSIDFRRNGSPTKNVVSMPQYFESLGYHTEAIGKVFHTPDKSSGEFVVNAGNSRGESIGKITAVPNTLLEWSEGSDPVEATSDWRNAQYGVKFLQQAHDKPFFLAIGIYRPHLPWHAPKKFFDMMPKVEDIILPPYLKNDLNDVAGASNRDLDKVLNHGGNKLWKESVRAYLANMAYADAAVGHLVEGLENSEYADNTIIVLWGDHGWHLGEKNAFRKGNSWERAGKTTFVIYDPSSKNSADIYHAVSLQDIYPTLIELTAVKQPGFPVRGRSLVPLIDDPQTKWFGTAFSTFKGVHSIYTNRYHFIDQGRGELYDLDKDPNEWRNLSDDPAYADVKSFLKKGISAMVKHDESPFEKPEQGDNIFSPDDLDSYGIQCRAVRLFWSDKSRGETGYRIRRMAVGEEKFMRIADIPASSASFTDTNVVSGEQYTYLVSAIDEDGRSVDVSNSSCVTLPQCP